MASKPFPLPPGAELVDPGAPKLPPGATLVSGSVPALTQKTFAQEYGITSPWAEVPLDFLQGVGAGALTIPKTAYDVGRKAGSYLLPEGRRKAAMEATALPEGITTPPASVSGAAGKFLEQGAEFLLPAGIIGKGEKAVKAATAGIKYAPAVNVGARAALEGAGAGATTLAQTGSPEDAAKAGAIGVGASGVMQGVGAGLAKVTPFVKNRLNAIQQAAMDWAEQHGIPLSAGQRSGNQMVTRLEHNLENTVGASGRSQQFFKDQEQALTAAGRGTVATTQPGASLNPYEAGQGMATRVKSVISDAKADADKLYGDLRNEYAANQRTVQVDTKPSTVLDAKGNPIQIPVTQTFELPVNVTKAKASLQPIYDELSKTMPEARRQSSPGYTALKQLLDGPDMVDAVTADRNLSALKSLARSGNNQYLNSRSQGLAKTAISSLETDFGAALNKASPSLAPKLQAARDAVRKQHTVAEILNSLPDEPAALYKRLITAGDRTYNDLAFLNNVAPQEMRQIGRTFLDELFNKATAEGGFRRAAGVMVDWQRLGPNTKKLLFGAQANIQELNNFFQAAKQLTVDVNPSGTGKTLAALGALGIGIDTLQHPGGIDEKAKRFGKDVLIAGTVSQGLSRLLLTPGGAKFMTQAMSSPVGSPTFRQAVNGLMALSTRGEEKQAGAPEHSRPIAAEPEAKPEAQPAAQAAPPAPAPKVFPRSRLAEFASRNQVTPDQAESELKTRGYTIQ